MAHTDGVPLCRGRPSPCWNRAAAGGGQQRWNAAPARDSDLAARLVVGGLTSAGAGQGHHGSGRTRVPTSSSRIAALPTTSSKGPMTLKGVGLGIGSPPHATYLQARPDAGCGLWSLLKAGACSCMRGSPGRSGGLRAQVASEPEAAGPSLYEPASWLRPIPFGARLGARSAAAGKPNPSISAAPALSINCRLPGARRARARRFASPQCRLTALAGPPRGERERAAILELTRGKADRRPRDWIMGDLGEYHRRAGLPTRSNGPKPAGSGEEAGSVDLQISAWRGHTSHFYLGQLSKRASRATRSWPCTIHSRPGGGCRSPRMT